MKAPTLLPNVPVLAGVEVLLLAAVPVAAFELAAAELVTELLVVDVPVLVFATVVCA